MARIDKLIQAIAQFRADGLVLSTGEKVTLMIGSTRKTVSPQPVTSEQIQDLLEEIAPSELAETLAEDGEHHFPYSIEAGDFMVRVVRDGGSLQMHASPAGQGAADETIGDEAAASAPAPEAPPAPAVAARPRSASPAAAGKALPVIEALFAKMVEERCSDLHLSSGYPPLYRKDGEIVPIGDGGVLSAEKVSALLLAIAPETKLAEFSRSHDVDFSYEIAGLARFRCNLFEDRRGMGGVFRVIPTDIASAEKLGLPKTVMQLCELHKGLVLVTGPTGSGKSTTLAAMIDHINANESVHIITIEDPIEFVHPPKKALINQREVGNHTQGFKNALRAALREDPDIVLVGEMRDLETVAIAIETAETGHLVFGTMHTNSAPSTVDRIIDQFPPDQQNQVRTMLSESLKGVVTQTLCRKKGGGRVAALEILLVNSAISNLIREGKTFQIPSIMQTGRAIGMVTLSDALFDLVKKGLVEPPEALACAVNKGEFKATLERSGIKLG